VKRPLGLTVLSILFAMIGLTGLTQASSQPVGAVVRWVVLAMAVLSLAVAWGIHHRRGWTLRCYVVWAVTALAWAVVRETAADEPAWMLVTVVILFLGAVYFAVGYYLKDALARSAPG
jgi:hypothetical protein